MPETEQRPKRWRGFIPRAERLAKLRARIAAERPERPKAIKLWLEIYESHLAHTVRPETHRRVSGALENFFQIVPKLHRPPASLGRADIVKYKLTRMRKGISESTIQTDLAILKSFYFWLMDRTKDTKYPVDWNPFEADSQPDEGMAVPIG